jgi:hypothetical protein
MQEHDLTSGFRLRNDLRSHSDGTCSDDNSRHRQCLSTLIDTSG